MSLFPIPVEEIAIMRHLSQDDATAWLATNHPDLSPEDVAVLLRLTAKPAPSTTLAPQGKQRAYIVDPKRNRFLLAANYAGVSQYQLATLFGITRQTVYSILRIHKERDESIQRYSMRWNSLQLNAMRDWYFSNPAIVETPLASVIQQLISIAHACTDDPSE